MWTYTGCCGGQTSAPVWCRPHHAAYLHWCSFSPKDITASTGATSAQATIGGVEAVFLSLEYVKDAGATTPSVKVTIADSSGTGEWKITTIPDGFQVKRDFASIGPNATVELDVNGCTAQLKWFELTC